MSDKPGAAQDGSRAKTKVNSAENEDSFPQRIVSHPIIRPVLPFAIGGISGMVATTCIQPIDMVKVRMQLYGEGAKGGPRPNPFAVAKDIVAQGRALDLYTGLSAGLLRQAVYSTARIGFFDTIIAAFQSRAEANGTKVGFTERGLAGLSAGAMAALLATPTEVGLIRMQSDGLKPKESRANYRSVFDVLARVAREEGVLSLWNGALPTVARAMATNFGQLAFFSEAKSQLQQRTSLSAQSTTITASMIAGFFASFFSLPFDFIKTRLQRQTKAPDGTYAYNGMFDCFLKVTKNEGILRFYRGFGTYFARIAPHVVITLIVADNLGFLVYGARRA